MISGVFEYKGSRLAYTVSGNGPKTILLFHGFGQSHKAFEPLQSSIANNYAVYNFDLYFHGKSEWCNGEKPLEKAFWNEMFQQFLTERGIKRFSICGFSIGCRFVMTTVEAFVEQIEDVYLLAPDGIKRSFWYTISTYPYLLRQIFKSMILHPSLFRIIIHSLFELRLMKKGLLKFAEHQMNTVEKRRKVYFSWVVFRHLFCDVKEFTELVNYKKIPLTVVVGRKDQVITAKSMNGFLKQLSNARFEILDIGHAGLLKDPALVPLFRH
jgi:pimeloyl-ACP methyl ester carboxylesterase